MFESIRLRWEAWHAQSEQSIDALDEATHAVVVAIIQTLANRAYRRPELSSAEPLESAIEQRGFDEATIEAYHENIKPEVEALRNEFVVRKRWSPLLDRLVYHPDRIEDLRELAIKLEQLRVALQDGGDTPP